MGTTEEAGVNGTHSFQKLVFSFEKCNFLSTKFAGQTFFSHMRPSKTLCSSIANIVFKLDLPFTFCYFFQKIFSVAARLCHIPFLRK